MSERADATWIARSREETLFGALYQRHYRAIRDFCRRRVPKDVVDDVVAETFLTAWRRIDDIPRGDQSLLWLYGVAYRVIGHHWRSAARRRRLEERMYVINGGAASAADDAVVASDQRRLVLDAAARLNEKDADVLRLAAWEQLSIADIAAVLGIAPNAVKQRLHRAKHNLGREYRKLESGTHKSTPEAPKAPDAPKGGVR
jgi:RNA polymerase sigma-70 factor (ECF subfamily)